MIKQPSEGRQKKRQQRRRLLFQVKSTFRTVLLSEDGVLPAHRANLQGSPSMCSVTPSSEVCEMSREQDKCNGDICDKHSCLMCKHTED